MTDEFGMEDFPLIYTYDLKKITKSDGTTSENDQQDNDHQDQQSGDASEDNDQHDLMRQLQDHTKKTQQDKRVYREDFRLTGCNMRQNCQFTLRLCRAHMLEKRPVQIRVEPEPTNPVDRNALCFQVQLPEDLTWHTVGYVAADKISKVRSAYDNHEIMEMEMEIPHFGHSARVPGYFSTVHIVKQGKWLPNDPNYVYLKP